MSWLSDPTRVLLVARRPPSEVLKRLKVHPITHHNTLNKLQVTHESDLDRTEPTCVKLIGTLV